MKRKRPHVDLSGPQDLKPRFGGRRMRKQNSLLGSLRGLARSSSGRVRTPKLLFNKPLQQRVVTKARVSKTKGKRGTKALRAHLNYLERSGVSIDGREAQLRTDGGILTPQERALLVESWGKDPYHFRFIISPERGWDLDLEAYTKRLVQQMERDFGTKLQWVSVPHFNTDNAHIHLVIRGQRDDGRLLEIERNYIRYGMRLMAEREATLILGPRVREPLQVEAERDVAAERLTALDRAMIEEQKRSGVVAVRVLKREGRMFEQVARLRQQKRLSFLRELGLSIEVRPGVWRLDLEIERSLRHLGKRIEVFRSLEQRGLIPSTEEPLLIHMRGEFEGAAVRGIVIDRGTVSELSDERSMVIQSLEGQLHYIELDRFSEPEGFGARPGALVDISMEEGARADQVIVRFSERRGGIFSLAVFLRHVEQESRDGRWQLPEGVEVEEYVKAFEERLKNLVDVGIVAKVGDAYRVPSDLVEQVAARDKALGKRPTRVVRADAISPLTLEEMVKYRGATWLDSLLERETLEEKGTERSHLDRAISLAMRERAKFLQSEGHSVTQGVTKRLFEAEFCDTCTRLAGRFGRPMELRDRSSFEGALRQYERLGSGYFAVVERAGEFALIAANGRASRLEVGERVFVEVGSRGRGFKVRTWAERVHGVLKCKMVVASERTRARGGGEGRER